MCRLFLMTVALLAILFGLSGLYMMPKLVQQKIEQKIQLKIGTKTWDRFTRVPIPLTVKFYFFNISNADRVLAGLERPHFQEVGPFVFKQWRRREVMDITDNNRKITYREFKTFYASWPAPPTTNSSSSELDGASAEDQDQQVQLSAHSPDGSLMLNPYAHQLTLVNLPLLTVLNQLAKLDEGSLKRSVAAKVVGRLIKEGREQILVTRPANEWLFDGYKVGLMEAASELISTTLGYNFDSPLPRNKFGFFHGKNNTWSRREAGEMTVYTGRNESMRDFMRVDNWNGLKTLSVWPRTPESGNRCNEIRGTDGSQFHPGVTRDQVLDIFSPMICSSIFVKYAQDTEARQIPLLRFTTPPDVFAAPRKSPRNACYCTIDRESQASRQQPPPVAVQQQQQQHHGRFMGAPAASPQTTTTPVVAPPPAPSAPLSVKQKAKITDSRCYIDGLMDLSLCQRGAPIAASGPHFYNSDPMLAMAAGLTPQKHLHETYLDIEPMTGSVFRAASRAQLNALVEQAALEVVEPALVGNMSAMVAPLLWLEESAAIDDKSAREFKGQLLNVVQKGRRSFFYAIAFGCLLALVVALQFWYVTCYKIDTSTSTSKEEKRGMSRAARRKAKLAAEDAAAEEMRQRRGSRRARNLAATPLVAAAGRRGGGGGGDKKSQQQGDKSTTALATAGLLAAAGLAGAADAAVTANQRRRERQQRRTRRGRADYESSQEEEEELDDERGVAGESDARSDDDDQEERLSKRGLVDNEWTPGRQSGTTTSDDNSASPVASSSFGGGPEDEPRPRGDPRRPISETDFD